MVIGAILMGAAALAGWGYVLSIPEKEPEEKITSTGVVEQALTDKGVTRYVIRFTGERNCSYLAKTAGYTGNTEKYEDGKLVHIRYWFGKKAPGAEILDGELTAVAKQKANRLLLLASGLFMIAGILCVVFL